ncbi:hypothetical protein LINGRAHAP2_LOCUS1601, partial [Linum grandiflorum]
MSSINSNEANHSSGNLPQTSLSPLSANPEIKEKKQRKVSSYFSRTVKPRIEPSSEQNVEEAT